VWENVRDGSECNHDESERRVGAVKSVGPVDNEPHAPIESLVAGIVHPEANRGEDPRLALADGLGRDDERLEPAARRSRLCKESSHTLCCARLWKHSVNDAVRAPSRSVEQASPSRDVCLCWS
jgi:hypothetical protein